MRAPWVCKWEVGSILVDVLVFLNFRDINPVAPAELQMRPQK